MPTEQLVYRGWIGGKEIDRIELEMIGVNVGQWNPICTFDGCSMTVDVYRVFSKRWKGRWVWGMIAKKEMVYSQRERDQQLSDEDIPF